MTALARYNANMEGEVEPEPIERLRFFLSLALTGQDWLDVEQFIDGVSNQLASRDAEIESLRQQLADHIRREVMLRDALHFAHEELRGWHEEATGEDYNSIEINEALAATADLKDVILCHAEPCRDDGRCQYAIDHGAEGLGHCPEGKCCIPLYRA